MNRRLILAIGAATLLACNGSKAKMVDNKPTASFKFTQSTTHPQSFSFDASASSIPVGTLSKYAWLFGDEATGVTTTTDATTSTTTHSYTKAGTFTVTLVVSDDQSDESDPVSQMVTVPMVNTTAPMAIITGPTSGSPNVAVTFDGSTSTPTGSITNYAWNFGDGMTVMGSDKGVVQHTFTTAGQFDVTLEVTDSDMQNDTAELHIAIGSAGPLAICQWSPTTVSAGSPVMFDGSGSSAPGSTIEVYVWDFGDGVMNVPGEMVSHSYATPGTYTPKLKIVDALSRSNTGNCADVVVGAAGLCDAMYQWMTTSSSDPLCAFSGTTVTVDQSADGGIVVSEPYTGATMLTYTGSWTGSTFTATGTYMDTDGFQHDVTVTGTFSGCGSWIGTYDDNVADLVDCNSNVSATKL